MERNILLTIEYDGTNFSGWQKQPGRRTVQGEIEMALSRACGITISINGTSRTDAGVHALGQRASFNGNFGIPTDRIKKVTNNILCGGMHNRLQVPDVRIISAQEVDKDFHARFNCKGKKYRYIISNKEDHNIFERNHQYQITSRLDVDTMKAAAGYFVGEHDFAAFQSAGGTPRETTVRNIHSLEILEKDGIIAIEVAGDGFLYNMVRIITGTLVDVGLGKIKEIEIPNIIAGADRRKAGHTAPPQGLYLVEIYY